MTAAAAQQKGDPGAQQLGRGVGTQSPISGTAPQEIKVYKVQAAPLQAAWVSRFLAPVHRAIGVPPCPLEFRPTGIFGGYAAGSKHTNPDGRISLSSAVLWTKTRFVRVYVHELCHGLLDSTECKHGHDAAFFTLNFLLLQRLERAQIETTVDALRHTNSMSLYDLQDPLPAHAGLPDHAWQPREIGWALALAHELRDSEIPGRELAHIISDRYFQFADAVSGEEKNRAEEAQKRAAAAALREAEIRSLRDKLQLQTWLTCLAWAGFFAVFYLWLA